MKNGTEMTTDELVTILEKEVVNKKVTFSGGEPLMQVDALIDIVKNLKGLILLCIQDMSLKKFRKNF